MIALFGRHSFILLLLVLQVTNGQTTIQICSNSRPCLNGGVCEKRGGFGRESTQLCNCKNTIRRDGTRYSGLYCERKDTKGADSTISETINDDDTLINNIDDSIDKINDDNSNDDDKSDDRIDADDDDALINDIDDSMDKIIDDNSNDDDNSDDIIDDHFSEDDAGSGDIDETNDSICSNGTSCLNGGICANNRCICRKGFRGLNCDVSTDKSNDETDTSNDENITEDSNSEDYTAAPELNTPGDSVCPDNFSCFNGGHCIKNTCVCRDGFIGRKCEMAITVSNSNSISSKGKSSKSINSIPFGNIRKNKDGDDKHENHKKLTVTMFAPLFAILAIAAVLLLVSYTRSKKENNQMVPLTTNKRNISSNSYIITEEELRAVAGLI